MSIITPLDNDYITFHFHEDKGIIHQIYKRGIGGDSLKEALDAGADYMTNTDAYKWLSDARDIDGLTDEEAEWVNEDWLQRMVEAGWQYWALTVPETTYARMNMTQFVTAFSERGIMVRVFTDPDAAMDWLENVA